MFTITKEFSFCASHKLTGLPSNHPCTRLHGHNYVIKVELKSANLNEVGFVKDYRELSFVKDYIDCFLDHKDLNEVYSFNPTAENLAKYLFDTFIMVIPDLSAVEVSETPKTNARYDNKTDY